MKIFFTFFFLIFSFEIFAEIKDKEMLSAYHEGCLEPDPDPITAGEQFLACGCITNEVSKVYTVEEIMDDEDFTENQKFNKIIDFCISLVLDSR